MSREARAHGTYVKYVIEQCRCDECRAANRDYERERSRRCAPAYVDADEVRAHLAWLADRGIGLKSVAKMSGLSHGALSKLVYGDSRRGTAPSKRCRPETRDRILAVHPGMFENGTRVPAGPTLAIVDELVRRGWTRAAIARGVHGPHAATLQLGSELITRKHAAAVKGLLAEPVPPRRSRHGIHPVPQPAQCIAGAVGGTYAGYTGGCRCDDCRAAGTEYQRARRARERGDEVDVERLFNPFELPELPRVGEREWRARAACRRDDVPVWLFYAWHTDYETIEAAKAVCATCPVERECLQYALDAGEEHGIFGGLGPAERGRLHREVAS